MFTKVNEDANASVTDGISKHKQLLLSLGYVTGSYSVKTCILKLFMIVQLIQFMTKCSNSKNKSDLILPFTFMCLHV